MGPNSIYRERGQSLLTKCPELLSSYSRFSPSLPPLAVSRVARAPWTLISVLLSRKLKKTSPSPSSVSSVTPLLLLLLLDALRSQAALTLALPLANASFSSGSASKMYFFMPVSNNTMCNFTVAASSNTMVGVYTAKSSTGTDLCNYGSVGGMAWYWWALIAILVIVLIAGVLAAAAGGFLMWKKKQQASLYDQA